MQLGPIDWLTTGTAEDVSVAIRLEDVRKRNGRTHPAFCECIGGFR